MYFNRKNAEQKNWRMIKKGKHFLFGCSLVFAVGASLATQVVHANTAETTVANNSTTGDVNPTPNGDGKTYEAPAAVAEIKPEVTTTPAVAEKLDGETAKEVKALDKTKLENYIAEIEAKLANGTYENKTEESVAVLKADLEAAKATLANATTQGEITKAYNKLITTANTKLKNKPVEKKETPAVDTTNGKETVGKKAENTEKKSESNSIENTGSNDPRNGKAIPTGIQFRAEVAVSDPAEEYRPQNNHYETHILNDINKKTEPREAEQIVGRVTDYKIRYNKDENGKITSLDWLVYFNDYLENLDNKYGTDGGELYRNYIQIPKEVNMPDTITRAQYASPRNPKFVPGRRGGPVRAKPNGQPLSTTTSFDNPTPTSASDLPRVGYDRFNLADWPSGGSGRYIENLAPQLSRYFKSAVSDGSPKTRDILRAAAIDGNRLIVDRATTGGSSYNGYVWSFTTTVPNDTTNEQLQNMKVVFGMMRSATAGANGAFINVASNPINMWKSDVYTPTAKVQTVKVGQKPDATKSIGNFNTLPQGTTVEYKNAVNTKTPGEQKAIAVVTYPDTSKKEVPVKVIVEKEAVAPAKPVITTSLTGKANTKTPVEVKAEAGSTVSLFAKDGTKLGTAVANAQGVASITPIVNIPTGIIAATATKNGKTSEVSDPVEATPAPVTPQPETPKPSTPAPGAATNKPAADAATSGPEIVNDLAGKASTPADVTIKAPAGSTVKLYNKDGVVIGEAVANDQGVATVHPTNSLPEGEITATSTPAGGTESAKSAPITVTKTPTPIENIPQTNGPYQLQMMTNATKVTLYRGDHLSLTGAAAGTALRYFGITKETAFNVAGVNPSGGLEDNRGSKITNSDAKAEGTVSWNQPLGDKTITFRVTGSPDPTSNRTVTIDRHIIVTVLEVAKKYEPVAGTKVDVANSNNLSEDDKNKVIASVKAANPSLPADSQYSVDEKGNLTITYPDGSKDKIAAAYLVNPAAPVVAPTVEIPYSNKATKEVYVYGGEANSFDIKFKDDSGKIASATVKQGDNKAFADVAGEANTINTQYGFKANVINAETPATADAPAVITYSGTPAATDGLSQDRLDAATKGENPEGLALGWRYATATDKDGAYIENGATNASNATDPGSFRVMLKGQTQKYDIATPTEKVTVADPANVTEAELAKIKEKLQLEYSKTNDDANLADKKGTAVADKDGKIQSVTKDDKGNLVVTYKDGSQDKKPLSEFVNVAPTVEVPYSNAAKRQIYVYTGENTDLTFTGKDETEVKDLYLRGPVNTTWDNAADYGLTTGKVENGAVTGEGTVSADKRTATIKMTGTTNLNAGQKWTSFIEAKDSDNAKSMTGVNYNVENDVAPRQQKPGYVQFIVKSQTDKYDIKTPTEKVAVTDPANVTEADLAKVKEKLQLEYKQDNDDANISKDTPVTDKDAKIQSVTKDADGNLVVTYTDGSTDKKPLSEFVTKDTTAPAKVAEGVKDPAKTSVKDPANLTDAEKAKVAEAVKKANPTAKDVEVGKDGTATVTFPDGSKAEIPAADLTKSSEDIFKQRPYVPSNGGGNNSGNGNGTSDNNGATNTDAKVDKAKLEGAIHQLDELIIKESAKLDAETAKEANALSADAKKVFANADATQAEVDAMVKRIEDFMAKVASSTDHAIPANDQAAQKPAVAPATAQAAANAGQTASVQANARKAAKELPNTGTADSTVAMVAAAASALLGLGIAGRRRKEDEEA